MRMGIILAALVIGAVISFGLPFIPFKFNTKVMAWMGTSVAVLVGLFVVKAFKLGHA